MPTYSCTVIYVSKTTNLRFQSIGKEVVICLVAVYCSLNKKQHWLLLDIYRYCEFPAWETVSMPGMEL